MAARRQKIKTHITLLRQHSTFYRCKLLFLLNIIGFYRPNDYEDSMH